MFYRHFGYPQKGLTLAFPSHPCTKDISREWGWKLAGGTCTCHFTDILEILNSDWTLIFPPHPCKKDMERRKKLSAGRTYHFKDILDIVTSELTRVFPPRFGKKGTPRTERILGSYHTHIQGISLTVTSVCPPPLPSSTWNVCFLSSPPLHTLSCSYCILCNPFILRGSPNEACYSVTNMPCMHDSNLELGLLLLPANSE